MNRDTRWITDSWVEIALIGILTVAIPVCVSAVMLLFSELAVGDFSTWRNIVLGTSVAWSIFLACILTSFYVRAVKRTVNRVKTH
jgi:hypothetical protein